MIEWAEGFTGRNGYMRLRPNRNRKVENASHYPNYSTVPLIGGRTWYATTAQRKQPGSAFPDIEVVGDSHCVRKWNAEEAFGMVTRLTRRTHGGSIQNRVRA